MFLPLVYLQRVSLLKADLVFKQPKLRYNVIFGMLYWIGHIEIYSRRFVTGAVRWNHSEIQFVDCECLYIWREDAIKEENMELKRERGKKGGGIPEYYPINSQIRHE